MEQENDITKLDKEYLMDIVKVYLNVTELARLACLFANESELLEIKEKVISQYKTVVDLWKKLDFISQIRFLYNSDTGKRYTEEEIVSKYDVQSLWDELDDEVKKEIIVNTLNPMYSISIIEKNANNQDLIRVLEELEKYTNFKLKEIVNNGR